MPSVRLRSRLCRDVKSRSVGTRKRLAASCVKHVALPHAARIDEHRRGTAIPHDLLVHVHHRLDEARALQQPRRLARIDHRQKPRRNTIVARHLGREQARAQGRERRAADEGRKEHAARLQHLPDLQQRTGQIVDAVQAGRRQHRIEAAGRKRQAILVAHYAVRHFCKMKTSVGRDRFAFAQQRGKAPIVRPEIENARKR